MRRIFVVCIAIAAMLLLPIGISVAAPPDVDVKISKGVTFDFTTSQVSQVSVALKVKCDPSIGSLALNVQVFQGDVQGFGFVPGVICDGKSQSVVAHVQSNFGTVYEAGAADVLVTDFLRGNTWQRAVTIA
jgi:hypothetical protein